MIFKQVSLPLSKRNVMSSVWLTALWAAFLPCIVFCKLSVARTLPFITITAKVNILNKDKWGLVVRERTGHTGNAKQAIFYCTWYKHDLLSSLMCPSGKELPDFILEDHTYKHGRSWRQMHKAPWKKRTGPWVSNSILPPQCRNLGAVFPQYQCAIKNKHISFKLNSDFLICPLLVHCLVWGFLFCFVVLATLNRCYFLDSEL